MIKPPALEDLIWALEWALENVPETGPVDPDWRGITAARMVKWRADFGDAKRLLEQAVSAEKQQGPPVMFHVEHARGGS